MNKYTIDEEVDRCFYIAGWILLAAAVALCVVVKVLQAKGLYVMHPCALHEATGLYCPGCGGTRAVMALFSGRILTSLYYHPFVPYAAVTGGWFLISQTLQRVTGRKIGMHFRPLYVMLALVLVFGNCILKSLVFLLFHISLM